MITSTKNQNNSNNIASRIVTQVKISLIFVITILLFALKASCADSTKLITAKNIFYVQVSGKSDSKSVAFEHVFHNGKVAYSYSVGVAAGKNSMSVPVSFHAFTTGNSNHLELALAVIPYIEKHTYAKHADDLDKQMYVTPTIGYRYQKANGGLFVKTGVGPQIFMDPPSSNFWNFTPELAKISGYVSVGISF